MRRITITDGVETVELIEGLVFTIKPKNICTTAVMASGRTVMDITGVKNSLSVPTGWLSRSDLQKLKRMIDNTHLLSVTYPGVSGVVTADFFVEQPVYKAFKYSDDGVDQWYSITLEMTQEGVD